MKVRFLNKQEAVREFRLSDYLKLHSENETKTKLNRYCGGYHSGMLLSQLEDCYASKISEFTKNEKQILKWYFKKVYAYLRNNPWLLPKKQKIGLIRLTGGIDWDAPFTLNHNIVLTNRILTKMQSNPQASIKTIIHEFTHIIQRYPELYIRQNLVFNEIYKKWGFIKINPNQLNWSYVNIRKLPPLRTNPDGHSYHWIFPLRGSFYLPTLSEIGGSEKEMGKMIGVLIKLEKKNNQFIVKNEWDYTKNFPDYLQLFYNRDEQLYHPNEILAVHLCDII